MGILALVFSKVGDHTTLLSQNQGGYQHGVFHMVSTLLMFSVSYCSLGSRGSTVSLSYPRPLSAHAGSVRRADGAEHRY